MPDPATSPNRQTEMQALARRFRQGVGLVALGLSHIARAGGWLAWLWLRRIGGLFFALIVLFEQWGWKPLLAALSRLAHIAPIAAIERRIAALPPYAALVAFALPTLFLLPLKLVALYLIAHGHPLAAGALFVGAKVVGTAVVARLYQLTEQQLMTIGWFRHLHGLIVPRLHTLQEEIRRSWAWRYGRMLKTRAKHKLAPIVANLKMRFLGRAS